MKLTKQEMERVEFLKKQIEENKKEIERLEKLPNKIKNGIAVKMSYVLYYKDEEGDIDFSSSDTHFYITKDNWIDVTFTNADGEIDYARFWPTYQSKHLEDGEFDVYDSVEIEEILKLKKNK
jgi:hypothetical protein